MNKFTVHAPEASFSGESAGVAFKDGAGQVDDSSKEGRAAIEYFRRRGYTLTPHAEADEISSPSAQMEDAGGKADPGFTDGVSGKPFDPSEHNADEVLAYLDSLGTDDSEAVAEFDRVIEAEKAGKNRKTIVTRGENQEGQQ